MRCLVGLICLVALACGKSSKQQKESADLQEIKDILKNLGNQVMLQDFYRQEALRSDGDSGVRRIRNTIQGTRPWYGKTHTMTHTISLHDHANNIRTMGLGEFSAVLNGFEFRTRHNDYRLSQPSTTSGDYHATQDLEFPEVPPAVLQQSDVAGQIREMREWFKAWQNQDTSVRDYRPYFRPTLCYLEGAWTMSGDEVEEPFYSDRHFLDAATWEELIDVAKFNSEAGRKSNGENNAFLPKTIIRMDGHRPVYAQWNYRIMCHPLANDLPLDRFRVIDDLGPRMVYGQSLTELAQSRAARFQLNPNKTGPFKDGISIYGMLDDMMHEIPGLNNYQADLTDEAFNDRSYKYAPEENSNPEPLNAGFYHRVYRSATYGAMGARIRFRGYTDETGFYAMTTQRKVAKFSAPFCQKQGNNWSCNEQTQRWTYAVPMEIVYLTPLSKWNPYNIPYRGEYNTTEAQRVEANGRNGGFTTATAYDGTHSKIFYQTPAEFFDGEELDPDPEDMPFSSIGVLDNSGTVREVYASGHRAFLPNIAGVGIIRQRYPIVPVYDEGHPTHKELDAVKDYTLQKELYPFMWETTVDYSNVQGTSSSTNEAANAGMRLKTGMSTRGTSHFHEVTLSEAQAERILDANIVVQTSRAAGHTHHLELGCARWAGASGAEYCTEVTTVRCDNQWGGCSDGHPRRLIDISGQNKRNKKTKKTKKMKKN